MVADTFIVDIVIVFPLWVPERRSVDKLTSFERPDDVSNSKLECSIMLLPIIFLLLSGEYSIDRRRTGCSSRYLVFRSQKDNNWMMQICIADISMRLAQNSFRAIGLYKTYVFTIP